MASYYEKKVNTVVFAEQYVRVCGTDIHFRLSGIVPKKGRLDTAWIV